jgi:hypothetical protein
VFPGPDGGHYRRSNYARRVFRPACDGRQHAAPGRPGRLIATDATIWPGLPVTTWPPAQPGVVFTPPRGRGIQAIPEGTPLASWLPLKPGLTPHGLRHGHKTWMAEDGIPEILAEQRLGHEVPGMRGLYAHASERMRDELKAALQARWEDSLRARAAIDPHSPVPLLDELLAPSLAQIQPQAEPTTPPRTQPEPTTPEDREKLISQIPPKIAVDPTLGTRMGSTQRASDLAKRPDHRVELWGFEPQTPSMRTLGCEVVRGRWRWSVIGRSPMKPLAVAGVAVLARCTASGPAGEVTGLERG